jgi:chromosome partitioning protein
MRRYAIINHKGGPGKTTTTVNLAGSLAQMGHRVLVVDVDAQGDLSAVFVDHHEDLELTVADLFGDAGVLAKDVIQPTAYENIFVIPADDRLNLVDKTHGFEDDPKATALLDAMAEVEERFDYVLFDCAGKVHLTGYAAIVAADEVIVPVEPVRFSIRNLTTVYREFCAVQTAINPNISIRFFLSKVDKRSRSQDTTRASLQKAFGDDRVLRTEIPDMTSFKTAINVRKPIVFHSKKSQGAQLARALAKEIIGAQDEQEPHVDQTAA